MEDHPDRDRDRRVLVDYEAADTMPHKDAAWSRLQAAIAAGESPRTDRGPAPPRRAWTIVLLLAAALLLALAGLRSLRGRHVVDAAPQAAAHDAATAPPRTVVRPDPPPHARPPEHVPEDIPKPPPRPRSRPDSDLDAELALLRDARAALAAADPSAALARLDEHARRFPRGLLTEERARLRVRALCDSGARDEARAVADAFARTHPDSPHAAKILAECRAP